MKKNKKAGEAPKTVEEDKPMTDEQMNELLADLHDTNFWRAVKRLISREAIIAENALCTIDPFKEPTESARNQGKRMGLYTIQSYVENLAKKRSGDEEEETPPIY